MDGELTAEYDEIGDILYLQTTSPYAEQDSREVAQGIVGRFNPENGSLEVLEIISPSESLRSIVLSLLSETDSKTSRSVPETVVSG